MRTSIRIFGLLGAAGFAICAAAGASGLATQQAKLTGDGTGRGWFGWAVGVADDTAVVGAMSSGSGKGAAYVFARAGSVWTPEATLAAADGTKDDLFGTAVAIDGDSVAVGANYSASNRGAVYVFTRTGAAWTQEGKLTAADAAGGDRMGISVAIAGDTVVAGAFAASNSRGAAYVFTRSGTTWTQQAKLAAGDAADYDQFGYSVAVAGDTVVVGAPSHDSNRGAVYVFARSGTTWTQQAKLAHADPGVSDQLGNAVAVAGDTVVAGAHVKDNVRGAAYVFTRSGTSWAQEAKLLASDGAAFDRFGTSVGISGDTAVVGAYGNSGGAGAGYVFERTGTTWSEKSRLETSDAANGDNLGWSVAVSGDTAVAGAPGKSSLQGAAYVFSPLAGGAPAGYVLPTKVAAKANAKHPERSTLTASGQFDTAGVVPDFSGAAEFEVGAFHFGVPGFVAKGRTLGYVTGGFSLTITPSGSGSSRALFSAKVTADLRTAVDLDGPLTLRFKNAAHDLSGTVVLTKGALGAHCVAAPDLCVRAAAASVKGGGKDALSLTLGFVTDGVVPPAAADLTIRFGDSYTSPVLPGAAFVKKRATHVFTARAPGITRVVVDYAKGTIAIQASRVDLGAFGAGAGPVTVTITRGGDTQSVTIRMSLAKSKLAY